MHDLTARKADLPAHTSDFGETRRAELGDYTVEFGTVRAGLKMGAETFHGLPDEACPCPHWGVLLSGEWRVPLVHGGVVNVRAGDAYYLPPDHHLEVVADSEYIEFSPHELYRQTHEAMARNASIHH
jgi:hypothetical protein